MEERVTRAQSDFTVYYESFKGLTAQQKDNFAIKYDHSIRVAELCFSLALKLGWTEEQQSLAYCTGLFHDIGRFSQLLEFDTFHDSKSVDHAEYSVKVLSEEAYLAAFTEEQQTAILEAIRYHNKRELPRELSASGAELAKLLRDADKLDILKVLTDYYTQPRSTPNHTLTWEMPAGTAVTKAVAKQVLAGELVNKELVANQMDIKIMQLSWVFDLNFKPSFKLLMEKRFTEKIYGTLPKNDTVIQIYRTVKVYSENKVLS
ncbi:HD domain-containing protein [Maribellus sediminis]|uniref:HD domain-containing protein n=1 Tax=Maribellus sediminis TaxID=2696285 RepID=UPI0014308CBE|nr:HD domain-containing protein [Maribellus sediminis]